MQRFITVRDKSGKVIYEGDDQRFYSTDSKKEFFGLQISDWIKMSVYVIGIIIFLVKADLRLTSLEESQKKLTNLSESFKEYMDASDGWHSAMLRTQFKGGRPIDGSFKYHNGGNIESSQ